MGGLAKVDAAAVERRRGWCRLSPRIALIGRNGPDPISLAELDIGTEEGTHLRGVLVASPRNGATLFSGDDFSVGLKFEQSGTPIAEIIGEVSINLVSAQFEILNGQSSQAVVLDQNLGWILRAQDVSKDAPISFRATLQSLDRNGKPIDVVLPDTIRIHVDDEWKFKGFAGIGRINNNSGYGLELEIGYKFRKANILQRGVPLQIGFAFGAGIDSLLFEDVSSPEMTDEALILDYRYWGSLGAAVGSGAPGISIDLGYMRFDRGLLTEVDSIYHDLERPATQSGFFQAGVDYYLADFIGAYAGTRVFFDVDYTEYFLQGRIRYGK